MEEGFKTHYTVDGRQIRFVLAKILAKILPAILAFNTAALCRWCCHQITACRRDSRSRLGTAFGLVWEQRTALLSRSCTPSHIAVFVVSEELIRMTEWTLGVLHNAFVPY